MRRGIDANGMSLQSAGFNIEDLILFSFFNLSLFFLELWTSFLISLNCYTLIIQGLQNTMLIIVVKSKAVPSSRCIPLINTTSFYRINWPFDSTLFLYLILCKIMLISQLHQFLDPPHHVHVPDKLFWTWEGSNGLLLRTLLLYFYVWRR